MSALRDLGVADKDIRTVNFSVYSQTKPEPVPAGSAEPAQINYTVDNTVSVTLRDPGKLGNLLQAALDKGANSVQSVTYSVDDPSKAMDEARKKAMEDARSQATELATAASVQLGKVITVSENVSIPQPVYAAPSYGKGGGGAGAVPTSAGMLEVQAQLTVVFAIE
jgi:uncharacterized protein YggE